MTIPRSSPDMGGCPFCGSKDVELSATASHWPAVGCNECGALGPCTDLHSDKAIEAWNARAGVAQSSAQMSERINVIVRDYGLEKSSASETHDALIAVLGVAQALVRCQRCGTAGDTFVLCAGCQSPMTPSADVTARAALLECASRCRYDGDLFHDQHNETRRDASWRAAEMAQAALDSLGTPVSSTDLAPTENKDDLLKKPMCIFCGKRVFGPCASKAMAAGCELPPEATSTDQGGSRKTDPHCQTCGRTDREYLNSGWSCNDPWHADAHLRAKASQHSSNHPRGGE